MAQILLTRNDIADRTQYLNAQNTFSELLNMGVIPIVNENDTLAVTEIRFGDNDTLSAITAGMVQADYLFLMTDVDCLYDKNPRSNPDAKAIEVVESVSDLEVDVSSAGSALGTGGMSTKIVAAKLATAAGVTTIITRSSKPGNVAGIVEYLEALKRASMVPESSVNSAQVANEDSLETLRPVSAFIPSAPVHTRFLPSSQPITDRRFWLLHGLNAHGTVFIDPGAAHALTEKAGLLPAGIVDVEGSFAQQECVRLIEVPRKKPQAQRSPSQSSISPSGIPGSPRMVPHPIRTPGSGVHTPSGSISSLANDPAAREIGRAVVTYSAAEIRLIAGLQSTEIASVLGYADSEYVALRENIAMRGAGERVESRPETPTSVASFAAGKISSGTSGLASYVEG